MAGKRLSFVLPSLDGGGAERVALTLVTNFIERGHEVDLVVARREGELLPLVPAGVRVIDLRARRLRNVLRPLIHYLRHRQPHAIQVSMWPLTVLALLAHRLARSKSRIIVSDHALLSLQFAGPRLPWLARTARLFYPWASSRVAVSTAVADDLAGVARLDRGSFEIIHNPVPSGKAPAAQERANVERVWGTGSLRILAVGVIKREKNYPLLLAALEVLLKRRPAKLVIVGDGPLRAQLEALIAERGLSEQVHLAGFQPSLTAWYESADIFALSSDEEGFANVLVEAMRCGLPVVSTDCGGPREILEDGKYGPLVRVGDADALAAAIEKALDDPIDGELLKARAEALSGRGSIDRYEALLLGTEVTA